MNENCKDKRHFWDFFCLYFKNANDFWPKISVKRSYLPKITTLSPIYNESKFLSRLGELASGSNE